MVKKLFSLVPLIVILLFAAFLRLYRIADYMTFLGDEGRDVLVVYNILHGHLTLLGPTSSVGGFFLGPIYYYFMAPFLWIFQYNPVGPAVMVAFFGIATVWLTYKIGSTFFNAKVGLVSALLFSISPVVIAYARSSWNPNLLPFFTFLTLLLLYKAVKMHSKKLFILIGILFGVLMQLHYLALFVGVIITTYLLFIALFSPLQLKKNQLLSAYVLIFVGFLIGLSPFLAFEFRHGFTNIMGIFAFVFHSKEVSTGGNFFMIVGNVFFRLFGRLVTDFPSSEQLTTRVSQNISVWFSLTLILAIASFTLFIWQWMHASKEKFMQYSLLGIWFIIGILLFGLYKKNIYDYYFEFMFPLPFLLTGNLFVFLWNKKIVGKVVACMSLILLVYINVQVMPFLSIPNRQLHQAEEISRFVLEKTDNKPFNFALIAAGNSDHEYRYFFTIWNRPPVTIQYPGIDMQRKSVTDQLLVVCDPACGPLGASLWEVAGFGRAEIAGKWDVSVVQVYKLTHYHGK